MPPIDTSNPVLSEREGAILVLTLNRPEKSNSLHPDLVSELSKALRAAEADNTLNVVVLTGAGRSFCAGLDLNLLVSWTIEEKIEYLRAATSIFQHVWSLPQPVIAAVNGPAIAGGFDLAAFCDIRLAADEALFWPGRNQLSARSDSSSSLQNDRARPREGACSDRTEHLS